MGYIYNEGPGGYSVTPGDGGQSGQATSDMIKAGGSGLSALAGTLLALRTKKKAKKIDKIQREMKRKSYIDQVNASLLEEGEGDRREAHGMENLKGVYGAHGLGESSARNYAVEEAKHSSKLRTYALRKQRADLKYGYEKGEQIAKLQREIDKIQQQNAMITAAIDTAASVGSMAAMCDRAVKRDFGQVNPQDILARLMEVPISTWRYEWESKDVRHLGPVAQDWHEKLGFGNHHDGKMIDYVDAFGVALTTVQALAELVAQQNKRIRALEEKRK